MDRMIGIILWNISAIQFILKNIISSVILRDEIEFGEVHENGSFSAVTLGLRLLTLTQC